MSEERNRLTFDEYGKLASGTDVYPNTCKPWVYALGLAGEAGETCDKMKKIYRDKDGVFKSDERREIALELGDVLWYVTRLAACLGFGLEEIAALNAEKLASRAQRGKLHGNGDNR